MAFEEIIRSSCESGERAADRQISRMRSGFRSKRMRESALRDFSLVSSRGSAPELRTDVHSRRCRRSIGDRNLPNNAIGLGDSG